MAFFSLAGRGDFKSSINIEIDLTKDPFYNEIKVRDKIFAFIFLVLFPVFSPAAVLKITVDAAIHPVTSQYIRGAIDRADREQASLIIMVLNTPEGRVFVHGEFWQAEADAPVPKGSPIKVIQVLTHLKLRVTKANDGNK